MCGCYSSTIYAVRVSKLKLIYRFLMYAKRLIGKPHDARISKIFTLASPGVTERPNINYAHWLFFNKKTLRNNEKGKKRNKFPK